MNRQITYAETPVKTLGYGQTPKRWAQKLHGGRLHAGLFSVLVSDKITLETLPWCR